MRFIILLRCPTRFALGLFVSSQVHVMEHKVRDGVMLCGEFGGTESGSRLF